MSIVQHKSWFMSTGSPSGAGISGIACGLLVLGDYTRGVGGRLVFGTCSGDAEVSVRSAILSVVVNDDEERRGRRRCTGGVGR